VMIFTLSMLTLTSGISSCANEQMLTNDNIPVKKNLNIGEE